MSISAGKGSEELGEEGQKEVEGQGARHVEGEGGEEISSGGAEESHEFSNHGGKTRSQGGTGVG